MSEDQVDNTVCEWIGWCARTGDHEVELSNKAGTERMVVCRLHLAPAQIYGYKPVADDATRPPR